MMMMMGWVVTNVTVCAPLAIKHSHCSGKDMEQSATGSDVINNIVIILSQHKIYLFSLSFPGP